MLNKPRKMPKLLVISVPKSGTHLLLQLTMGIPGMEMLQKYNPWCYETDLSLLRNMKSGQVALSHFSYSSRYLPLFRRLGIKPIFISRDPRDIAVSLTHFMMKPSPIFGVKQNYRHHMFKYMHHLPNQEQRLLAIIQGVRPTRPQIVRFGKCGWPSLTEYTSANYQWLGKPGIHSVTFEEMVRNSQSRTRAVKRIVEYIWGGGVPLPFSKVVMARRMIQNIKPSQSTTFRNGRIGNWRTEFTPRVKKAFKKETGDLLQRLGYEKNARW
ncbi:Sulfotransferase domain-containing protein [Marininema mesophilum]|uniref:Sulfotransferase domain-containing protein n=1 Tax=Marininema mesophilum TaxID=1048340 RepID=A0A1H2UKM2_9BACL|nr:sulfotransferase domain-containing protein [Marininema mesophilum]SDW56736.1 Sulfotransferase domain-containing protein [Marininema mesophilum]